MAVNPIDYESQSSDRLKLGRATPSPFYIPYIDDELRAIMASKVPPPPPSETIARPAVDLGRYEIRRIANGYLVESIKEGGQRTLHYAEDYKQVGEFIAANCVKWDLEGKEKRT